MDDLENGTPWFSQFQQATSSSNAAESLLWILSDSNLPTGGFVASAGLESFFAHGFLHDVGVPIIPGFSRVTANNGKNASSNTSSADRVATSTASFLYLSLSSYARTALPFIMDVHAATSAFLQRNVALKSVEDDAVAGCVSQIERFDQAYHSMTLNHVLRRASKAQGIALLTLYSKSFAQDLDMGSMWTGESETEDVQERDTVRSDRAANLMSELKRKIRKAASRDETPFGHLPICWAAFCAALDIPIESTVKLHLFLQARAILSSSVRLSTLGPYLAHSMLHHAVRRVLAEILGSKDWLHCATSGLQSDGGEAKVREGTPSSSDAVSDRTFRWDWPEEGSWSDDECKGRQSQGSHSIISPANTWPLGEIVQARHDSLHSRLFNS